MFSALLAEERRQQGVGEHRSRQSNDSLRVFQPDGGGGVGDDEVGVQREGSVSLSWPGRTVARYWAITESAVRPRSV